MVSNPSLKRRAFATVILFAAGLLFAIAARADGLEDWKVEFPNTDFAKTSIDFAEIGFDGPTRDVIPAIDRPRFAPVAEVEDIGPLEPVLSIDINGDHRAYPLRILLWHELVNDVVGGVPVLVSYCPLCSSGVVFDRRLDGHTLSFGNTGRIRHFDMVMYDHQSESWWQQFSGEAIVGAATGMRLKALPARLESLDRFRKRAPGGTVLIPENPMVRPYGMSPYAGMDSGAASPDRYPYILPKGVRPLERVVIIGDEAWTLAALRRRKTIRHQGLVLTWSPGQNSLHDKKIIGEGRDVGNVTVQRKNESGYADVPYDVAFAFAFRAFRPNGKLHIE